LAVFAVQLHQGDRDVLRELFELADDSPAAIASYLDRGLVFIAAEGGRIIGHAQFVETGVPDTIELKSLAVHEDYRGRGVATALVSAGEAYHASQARRLIVATAAADIGNLRFYQRIGFRMQAVERDAFTAATGCGHATLIDGVPLRDRVWFDKELK
jgi:GNAT superfamily N-acetyltransferase